MSNYSDNYTEYNYGYDAGYKAGYNAGYAEGYAVCSEELRQQYEASKPSKRSIFPWLFLFKTIIAMAFIFSIALGYLYFTINETTPTEMFKEFLISKDTEETDTNSELARKYAKYKDEYWFDINDKTNSVIITLYDSKDDKSAYQEALDALFVLDFDLGLNLSTKVIYASEYIGKQQQESDKAIATWEYEPNEPLEINIHIKK